MALIDSYYLQSLSLSQVATHLLWELSMIEASSNSEKSTLEAEQASTQESMLTQQQLSLPGFQDDRAVKSMDGLGSSVTTEE